MHFAQPTYQKTCHKYDTNDKFVCHLFVREKNLTNFTKETYSKVITCFLIIFKVCHFRHIIFVFSGISFKFKGCSTVILLHLFLLQRYNKSEVDFHIGKVPHLQPWGTSSITHWSICNRDQSSEVLISIGDCIPKIFVFAGWKYRISVLSPIYIYRAILKSWSIIEILYFYSTFVAKVQSYILKDGFPAVYGHLSLCRI